MVSSMFGRNIVSNSPVKPFELLGFFQQKRPPFLVTVFWRNVLRGVKWWTEMRYMHMSSLNIIES